MKRFVPFFVGFFLVQVAFPRIQMPSALDGSSDGSSELFSAKPSAGGRDDRDGTRRTSIPRPRGVERGEAVDNLGRPLGTRRAFDGILAIRSHRGLSPGLRKACGQVAGPPETHGQEIHGPRFFSSSHQVFHSSGAKAPSYPRGLSWKWRISSANPPNRLGGDAIHRRGKPVDKGPEATASPPVIHSCG